MAVSLENSEGQKREREILLALLLLLLRDTKSNLLELAAGYYAGHITLLELHDGIVSVLRDAHSHAAYLGRRLAGDTSPFGMTDQHFADSVLDGQAQYLEGLFSDIENGRYDAKPEDPQAAAEKQATGQSEAVAALAGALVARLTLYALALRPTAQASWLFQQSDDVLIEWRLGPADHCSVCPEVAAGSPYKASEMHQVPGDGQTPCLANCDCEIAIVDGEGGIPFMQI